LNCNFETGKYCSINYTWHTLLARLMPKIKYEFTRSLIMRTSEHSAFTRRAFVHVTKYMLAIRSILITWGSTTRFRSSNYVDSTHHSKRAESLASPIPAGIVNHSETTTVREIHRHHLSIFSRRSFHFSAKKFCRALENARLHHWKIGQLRQNEREWKGLYAISV